MKKLWPWAAAAFALTLLVHLRAAGHGFLEWDDAANLLANERYRALNWDNLRWMLTTHHRGPWQPLSWLSWCGDHALWGLDPRGYHLTNALLHAANAALFVLAAAALLGPGSAAGAFLGALFFSLHPLRVESVAWATERRDVLSGFFFLAALLAYARLPAKRRGPGLAACLGLFLLSLLSKGTAVGLPWVLLAIDYWRGRLDRDARVEKIPFFILALAAGLANLSGFWTGALAAGSWGPGARVLLFLYDAAFYLRMTLWPAGLSPYYSLPSDLARLAAPLCLHAAVAIAITEKAFRRRRERPGLWAAWLSYLLVLAPVSGLLQSGQQIAADRYSYLAALPFALLAGAGVEALARRWGRARALGLGGAAVLALAALSWRQIGFWKDDVSLWSRAVAVDPSGYLPRSNLATALLVRGDDAGAALHYEAAVGLEPRDREARLNLGAIRERQGRPEEARRQYEAALALKPGDPEAANNLALLAIRAGRRREAAAMLEAILAREPGFAPARFNLGVLRVLEGRRAEGERHLREALRLEPGLVGRLKPRAGAGAAP